MVLCGRTSSCCAVAGGNNRGLISRKLKAIDKQNSCYAALHHLPSLNLIWLFDSFWIFFLHLLTMDLIYRTCSSRPRALRSVLNVGLDAMRTCFCLPTYLSYLSNPQQSCHPHPPWATACYASWRQPEAWLVVFILVEVCLAVTHWATLSARSHLLPVALLSSEYLRIPSSISLQIVLCLCLFPPDLIPPSL